MLGRKTIFLIVFGSVLIIAGIAEMVLDIVALPISISCIVAGIALVASRIKRFRKLHDN